MANNHETKNFAGLFSQANTLSVPDGALESASNIVISKDGTITKNRGYYDYYTPSSETLSNIYTYQSQLLALFNDKIAYLSETGSSPNETGTRNTLSGATVTLSGNRVGRFAESNKNCYFTTDNGVLKLEAYNGTVYKSGIPPALDLRGRFLAANGVIGTNTTSGAQVAWRVVFGRRDANDNLLLGAPSDILNLTNASISGTYNSAGVGPYTVTFTAASAHNLATGMTVTTFGAADADANGSFTVTVTSSTVFTYSTTGNPGTGDLAISFIATRKPRLEFSIPSEIDNTTDGYFYRIYRSAQSITSGTAVEDNFALIDEVFLATADLTQGFITYDDTINDAARAEFLYTNSNQEGADKTNDRPPKCDDIALFKNHMFYGNITQRQFFSDEVSKSSGIQLTDATVFSNGAYFETKIDSTIVRYVAQQYVGNSTVISESVATGGGGQIVVTYTTHGFSNNDSIVITNQVGGTLASGTYYIINKTANTFEFSATIGGTAVARAGETAIDFEGLEAVGTVNAAGNTWTRTSNVVTVTKSGHGLQTGFKIYVHASAGGTPNVDLGLYTITVVDANTFTFAHTGADDGSGNTLDYLEYYPMFKFDKTDASVSVQLRETAQGMVRAINRKSTSGIYANYTSAPSDNPGRFQLKSKVFSGAIYLRASAASIGNIFNPYFPTSFSSGFQTYSTNSSQPNAIYISKIKEPDAVPIAGASHVLEIGAVNKNILRLVPLRDSLIVLKEDGVFRINGDSVATFNVIPLDTSISVLSGRSAAVINNVVICLTTDGIVEISDNSVTVISRRIEDPITASLGASSIATETAACANELDRLYYLSTIAPNQTTNTQVYVYNILNSSWTTSTNLFKNGGIGPNNKLYIIDYTTGRLKKERRGQTRIDFCGQNYSITVNTVASNLLSATITSATGIPADGWVIVKNNIFTRIKSATSLGGSGYSVTFEQTTNLVAADTPILYAAYTSIIKPAPFHAGAVGLGKQFSQFQIHPRDESISRVSIVFAGDTYGSSEEVIWRKSSLINAEGWGDTPFGLGPWGDSESSNIEYGSQPSPIIRVYIPIYGQRTSYLQPIVTHASAGEAMNVQAFGYTYRAYKERVSR